MSRESLSLPRGLVSVRARALPTSRESEPLAAGAVAGPVATMSVPARTVQGAPPSSAVLGAIPAGELKAIQTRAFERGCAVERQRIAAELGALILGLEKEARTLDEMRRTERGALATFGVEVAVAVATELVGAALGAGQHDVRKLVEAAVAEMLPAVGHAPLTIALHPDDLRGLDAVGVRSTFGASTTLELAADPSLKRGACRIRAQGAELDADPRERLKAMGDRLRALAGEERPHA